MISSVRHSPLKHLSFCPPDRSTPHPYLTVLAVPSGTRCSGGETPRNNNRNEAIMARLLRLSFMIF
jgi:hypothetical protein